MTVSKRTTVDDDGGLRHVLEYEDDDIDFDAIVIQYDPAEEDLITVKGYEGEDVTYQDAFERRNLSFDPISVIGRGESERLEGVSPTDEPDDVPDDVRVAFNTVGFAPVPRGEWWVDE